jgi:phosphoglucomutase
MLIAEYLLSQRKEKGLLHSNGAFVTTIVSTDMAKAIAKEYNLKLIEVLTGFKFIGEQIKLFEQQGTYEYEFGFEESYGCLVGTHARDKDAPVAVMALCEAAAYYKSKGITLWDQMINIFEKYGYYREGQVAITMKGAEGASKIAQMMDDLRNNTPKKFGAWDVVEARDYKNDVKVNMATGEKSSTGLPSSNVLYYELNDNAWCCARPSGTEPKIKFYMGVKGTSLEDAKEKEEALKKAVMEVVGQ